MDTYTRAEAIQLSEEGQNGGSEKELFREELIPHLNEALPGCGADAPYTYDTRAHPHKLIPRIGERTADEPPGGPDDYQWPVLHDHDRLPDGTELYPQYFVVECGKGNPDIKDDDYVAAIDRHLKYIHIPEPYQDRPELTGYPNGALNTFAITWDNTTTYTGTYTTHTGNTINLNNVKFLN